MAAYSIPWVLFWFLLLPLASKWAARPFHTLPSSLPPQWMPVWMPVAWVLVAVGGIGSLWCLAYLAGQGRGTPAPTDPPKRLVTGGPYAHCRNPLMAFQFMAGLGDALLLEAWPMLAVGPALFLVGIMYLKLSEEPRLAMQFGWKYQQYRANVPMWFPRLTHYQPSDSPRGDKGEAPRRDK